MKAGHKTGTWSETLRGAEWLKLSVTWMNTEAPVFFCQHPPRNAPVRGVIASFLSQAGPHRLQWFILSLQPGHCHLTFALFLLSFTVDVLILQTGIFSKWWVSLRDLKKVQKDVLFKRPIGEGPAIGSLNTNPEVSSYRYQYDFILHATGY